MDTNKVLDRLSGLIILFIAVLTLIAGYIPKIKETIASIPSEYQMPVFIIVLILVAIFGIWNLYTSEIRSKNAYDQGLYEPVPPDAAAETEEKIN